MSAKQDTVRNHKEEETLENQGELSSVTDVTINLYQTPS